MSAVLTFLLDSFEVQIKELKENIFSSEEIIKIWSSLCKTPSFIDYSNYRCSAVHKEFILQPNINENILNELYEIYQKEDDSFVFHIIKHSNFSLNDWNKVVNESLEKNDYLVLSNCFETNNFIIQTYLGEEFSKPIFLDKLFTILDSKGNSQDGILLQLCLSKIILNSNNSKALTLCYNFLSNQNMLNVSWASYFLENPNTSAKILNALFKQFNNSFNSYHLCDFISHPNFDVKKQHNLILTLSKNADAKVYDKFLSLIRNNNKLSPELLENFFVVFLYFDEIGLLLLDHPNFPKNYLLKIIRQPKIFGAFSSKMKDKISQKINF